MHNVPDSPAVLEKFIALRDRLAELLAELDHTLEMLRKYHSSYPADSTGLRMRASELATKSLELTRIATEIGVLADLPYTRAGHAAGPSNDPVWNECVALLRARGMSSTDQIFWLAEVHPKLGTKPVRLFLEGKGRLVVAQLREEAEPPP